MKPIIALWICLCLPLLKSQAALPDWQQALKEILWELKLPASTAQVELDGKTYFAFQPSGKNIIQIGEILDKEIDINTNLNKNKKAYIYYVLGHELYHRLTGIGKNHYFGKMIPGHNPPAPKYADELYADYFGCFVAQQLDQSPDLDLFWTSLEEYTRNDSLYPPLAMRRHINQETLKRGAEMYVIFKTGVLSAAVGDFETAINYFSSLRNHYKLDFLPEVIHNLVMAHIAYAQQLLRYNSGWQHAGYLLPLRWHFNSSLLQSTRRNPTIDEAARHAYAFRLLDTAAYIIKNTKNYEDSMYIDCIKYIKKDTVHFKKKIKEINLSPDKAWVTALAFATLMRNKSEAARFWQMCDTTEAATARAIAINKLHIAGFLPANTDCEDRLDINQRSYKNLSLPNQVDTPKISYSYDCKKIKSVKYTFCLVEDVADLAIADSFFRQADFPCQLLPIAPDTGTLSLDCYPDQHLLVWRLANGTRHYYFYYKNET